MNDPDDSVGGPTVVEHRHEMTLPVIEERLEVSRVAVDRGGVRITKRVEAREVQVDELLRHDRDQIERRPIGRRLAEGELPEARYEGETLVIPVLEEVLVVEKRLVLVEEVRITRVQGTHRSPQTVTLRREEISMERLAAEGRGLSQPPTPQGEASQVPAGAITGARR